MLAPGSVLVPGSVLAPANGVSYGRFQKGKERELVSEHQLLYTQYLQWSYLRRMSEASTARERPQLSVSGSPMP